MRKQTMEEVFNMAYLYKYVQIEANKALEDAIESLKDKIKNNNVKYAWYGNMSEYKVRLDLDKIDFLINDRLKAEFKEVSQQYLEANKVMNEAENK